MLGRAERFSRLLRRPGSEGGATVACAAAMPLLVLALAVAADYAKVSHFRNRVQVRRTRPRSPRRMRLRVRWTSPTIVIF